MRGRGNTQRSSHDTYRKTFDEMQQPLDRKAEGLMSYQDYQREVQKLQNRYLQDNKTIRGRRLTTQNQTRITPSGERWSGRSRR